MIKIKNFKLTMLLFLWFACSTAALAQERIVSGSIKDSNGVELPGVSVIIKATTIGTLSNEEGFFSIPAGSNAILIFSFIGYVTQEIPVGNNSIIDVVLVGDVQQLGEVVVTALGIERNTKSLTSSITKVPGLNLTQAREINLGASIQGRVAGVNVSKPATGPAGSSRVIIRGIKSLGGTNQPLYVIDGIPMDNTNFGQAGIWGGTDQGDGLSTINPDDIESISILKGASAAALYGSRGGYGVIIVTTKKGYARKGIGVEFNSNYVFEKVINYLDLQTEYGNGGLANIDPNDPTSPRVGSKPVSQQQAFDWESAWGAKLDGSSVIMWDGVSRPYSYVGADKNFDDFFETGHSFANTISFTGGSEKQTFRVSFGDMRSNSIIPNSGFDRKNVSLTTNGKFGKRLTFNAKVLYTIEDAKNRPMVSDSPGNSVFSVMLMAPNYNVNDMKGDREKLGAVPLGVVTTDNKMTGEEYQKSYDLYNQNPWWSTYQFIHNSDRDRLITSGQLRFDITNFLYLQGTIGMDYYVRNTKNLVPQGTGYQRGGSASERLDRVREVNQEIILGFDKEFGNISIISFVGGNIMTSSREYIGANGSNFSVPFFPAVTNTKSQSFSYGNSGSGINSLYGSLEVSYNRYLFLNATARNDWFSVLNPANNSKLYPSVGASFVFSDAFKGLPEIFSFGKIRVAWGQVATANVAPYASNLAYGLMGQGHLGRPLAQYTTGSNIPNPDLAPALSTEIEFGADLRFLKNRIGVDLTYYSQKTTDDILSATISTGSGFSTTSINIGELSNKGIEVLLTATPVVGNFTWDVSLNLAKNKNKVISLSPGINELNMEEPRTQTVRIKNIVGYPFGMITGLIQKTDAAGNRIYSATGQVVQSGKYEILGNGVADLTGGINNSLSYKQFNLSFLIDFKAGGDIYSGTNVKLLQAGLTKETLIGREGDLSITGVFEDGLYADGSKKYTSVETRNLTIEQARNYWNSVGAYDQANFLYDASFLKLRQISFGYNLPVSLLSRTPIKTLGVSFVGRNLATLYKNTQNIDPEASYTTSSSQGLDYFGLPSTRSYGFNIRVTF